MGSRGIAPHILNLDTIEMRVINSTPGKEFSPALIGKEAGWVGPTGNLDTMVQRKIPLVTLLTFKVQ
jgi:hypothetical protein